MTPGYTVHLQTAPLAALDADVLERFAEALERERRIAAPIAAASVATRTLGATVSVDVGTPQDAAAVAVEAFARAARRAGVGDVEIAELTVERDAGDGDRHELVSGGEVARRLGISRERVRQYAEAEGRFPAPAAIVGGYRVWQWGDIADWATVNERKVARRRGRSR